MRRVFINSLGDWGSIPGQVNTKELKKMVLDSALHTTQHYKIWINRKVEQSLQHLGVVAIEKGAFRSLST